MTSEQTKILVDILDDLDLIILETKTVGEDWGLPDVADRARRIKTKLLENFS